MSLCLARSQAQPTAFFLFLGPCSWEPRGLKLCQEEAQSSRHSEKSTKKCHGERGESHVRETAYTGQKHSSIRTTVIIILHTRERRLRRVSFTKGCTRAGDRGRTLCPELLSIPLNHLPSYPTQQSVRKKVMILSHAPLREGQLQEYQPLPERMGRYWPDQSPRKGQCALDLKQRGLM